MGGSGEKRKRREFQAEKIGGIKANYRSSFPAPLILREYNLPNKGGSAWEGDWKGDN